MVGTITVGDGCTSGVYDCAGVCDGDAVWDCNNECDGSAVLDDCGECGGNNSSCQVDIFYESDADFFGFQFGVNGAIVVSASGGAAELNGFTVSTGGATVIGFSFTGGFVPAGSGILTTLTIDGNADDVCLSDLVISGLSAALDSEVLDCLTISHEAAVLGLSLIHI